MLTTGLSGNKNQIVGFYFIVRRKLLPIENKFLAVKTDLIGITKRLTANIQVTTVTS